MHRIDELSYSLLPIAVVIGPMVALILLEPDFGTAMALVLIVAAMIFAAGLHYRYLIGTLLVVLPAIYVVLVSAPYADGDCSRSGIPGRIRWATVSRSSSRSLRWAQEACSGGG